MNGSKTVARIGSEKVVRIKGRANGPRFFGNLELGNGLSLKPDTNLETVHSEIPDSDKLKPNSDKPCPLSPAVMSVLHILTFLD